MPPALSDDDNESDGPDMIPAKGEIPVNNEDANDDEEEEEEAADDVEDDDDDNDDESEEEYHVEKIVKHGFTDNDQTIYQIKWLGYDKKSDLTWEPLKNLENALEIVEAYHASIGGPPQPPSNKKKGAMGKRSASAAFDSPSANAGSAKKGRKSNGEKRFTPPDGSWENHVARVASIVEEAYDITKPKSGVPSKSLLVLMEWNDGHKTTFPLETARRKCPQRLLDYYEQHLRFFPGDEGP
ncbi:hypothetical protein BDY17DRAFT_293727 [Neohortaea acidophila]|uniref:Chromo domain-containing protein n=1 Tax=Neohortaea acidophila TaxID=245834 RepID=A0A6A6Q0E5_9PEZI|nr:uncharacterized protein BDY17DRAFT_293727 [Neohortaea acidophila]KAF2485501.1 hypothetical protein BDY17DRAFT_293727 [Neohortaea acidophila]